MREASFYTKTGDRVRCELCPHMCVLKNDELGKCRARINKEGILMTLAYGNPCALHVDPIEKKPLYHFLPGTKSLSLATGGCNLACKNCQNYSISQATPIEVELGRVAPAEVVEMALAKGCASISYTYTEPTVYYEYMFDIARLAHDKGLKNVMVSAGYINPKPLHQLYKYIDAANIDLKCFDDTLYRKLSGIHLKPVLQTLKTLKEQGVWLEITNLIIPGYTDDIGKINEMLNWLLEHGFTETPIHFNRFVPTYQLSHLNSTQAKFLFEIAELALSMGMKHVYVGNVRLNPYQNTVCAVCGTLQVMRNGYEIENKMININCCDKCGEAIAGVWL